MCRSMENKALSFQLRKRSNDLKNRRLFKRGYMKEFTQISSAIKRMEISKKDEHTIEEEIAFKAGVDAESVIVHKEGEEGGLKSYRTFLL